jgi:hypothetical protein
VLTYIFPRVLLQLNLSFNRGNVKGQGIPV